VFHPLNAFDDGERVVLDVVRYERMFDRRRLGPEEGPPLLWRWTIDTATGTVREEQLSDLPLEFPRVDERVVGRRHTVGRASAVGRDDDGNDCGGRLVRIDGATGATTTIGLGPGRLGGEWVMVPRGDGEDEGWVLSLVYDRAADRSDLVVLDAGDPAAGP